MNKSEAEETTSIDGTLKKITSDDHRVLKKGDRTQREEEEELERGGRGG